MASQILASATNLDRPRRARFEPGEPQLGADVIEVHVAGVLKRGDEVQAAVALVLPASEASAAEEVSAGAGHESRFGTRHPGPQRRNHRHDLERRPGWVR